MSSPRGTTRVGPTTAARPGTGKTSAGTSGRKLLRSSSDWVFANEAGRPRWQETILARQLKPAAARAGIGKIGWHTFRHTYSTMLRSAGTDIKVQQELLRHANIQTTMNIYTQAVSDQKRAANSKVVEMVLSPAKSPAAAESEMNGSERERNATMLQNAKRASND